MNAFGRMCSSVVTAATITMCLSLPTGTHERALAVEATPTPLPSLLPSDDRGPTPLPLGSFAEMVVDAKTTGSSSAVATVTRP